MLADPGRLAARARGVPAAFQQAVATGDLQRLLDLIAPDVVLPADGGGVVRAALEPVVGAHPVADVLRRIGAASVLPAEVNGHPALTVRTGGAVDTVMAVRLEGGLIAGPYAVRNPEKLSRVDRETPVAR